MGLQLYRRLQLGAFTTLTTASDADFPCSSPNDTGLSYRVDNYLGQLLRIDVTSGATAWTRQFSDRPGQRSLCGCEFASRRRRRAWTSLGTGVAETPGCAQFSKVLAAPVTADNANVRYWFEITTASGTADTSVAAVRVFNRLQVPTSSPSIPVHRGSRGGGITAGCGGGNYCPTNTVTRGQMAVFLSKLAGLSWAAQ